MRLHGECVDLIAIRPPQACASVIKVNHQPFGLIAVRVRRIGDRVFGGESFLFRKRRKRKVLSAFGNE
jgi:hypothetical protein